MKTLKSTDKHLWLTEGSIDLRGKNSIHSWQVRGVGLVAIGVTNHLSDAASGSLSKIAHDFTGDNNSNTSCQGGGSEPGDMLFPKKAPKYGIVITTPPTQMLHDRLPGCKSSRAPGTLNAGP
jgi:hypothetical protein